MQEVENDSLDILRGTEHPLVDEPEFLKKLHWWTAEIDGNMLDVRKDIRHPQFTLSYNGTPFAPLGAIHALTGQRKNGKTMTETLLIAAILRGEYGGLRYELAEQIPVPTVLYVDTEMEEDNSLMVARRVHHIMGWPYQTPNDRFHVLWLRDTDEPTERWRKTLKAIWTYRSTVVMLDGIRDLIADFNDPGTSSHLVYQCMQVASEYKCSLWCVLHENPGSDKMRGHLGTELGNKISDTFVTKKTKNQSGVYFTVSQVDARGRDVDDFKFHVSDAQVQFGIPTMMGQEEAVKADDDHMTELDEAMKAAIQPPLSKKYGELKYALKSNLRIGSNKAQAMIKEAVQLGIIGIVDDYYTYRGQQKATAAELDGIELEMERQMMQDEINNGLPFAPPD